MIKEWLGLDGMNTSRWNDERSIKDWWINMSDKNIPNRRAMSSLATEKLDNLKWRKHTKIRLKFMQQSILLHAAKIEATL